MNINFRKEKGAYTVYDENNLMFYALKESYLKSKFLNFEDKKGIISIPYVTDYNDLFNTRITKQENLVDQILAPIAVGVMITHKCNLSCAYCLAKQEISDMISFKQTDKLIQYIVDAAPFIVMVSGGEPCCYPQLADFVTTLANLGTTVFVDTNGTKIYDLLQNNLNFRNIVSQKRVIIRISLDSYEENIHNKYRGHYAETLKSIKMLISLGADVRINTVLHAGNIDSLENLACNIKILGIKNWYLLRLQQGFAPKELWVSSREERKVVQKIRDLTKSWHGFNVKFVNGNENYSSFIIDSFGNYFTSDTVTGKKIILGQVEQISLIGAWRNSAYKAEHLNKYLKM